MQVPANAGEDDKIDPPGVGDTRVTEHALTDKPGPVGDSLRRDVSGSRPQFEALEPFSGEKPLANGASCLSCNSPAAPTAIPSNRPHQSEPANRSFDMKAGEQPVAVRVGHGKDGAVAQLAPLLCLSAVLGGNVERVGAWERQPSLCQLVGAAGLDVRYVGDRERPQDQSFSPQFRLGKCERRTSWREPNGRSLTLT